MAQVALSSIGGAIAGDIGRAIGAIVGAQIDGGMVASLAAPRQRGPRLETLKVQSSADGAPMACVFGRARVTGQVIWAARFLEARNERSAGKGGPRTVEHAYSLSFAVALGEGPIDGVARVWADGRPLDLGGAVMRVHLGTEDQQPDPLIEAVEGEAPAYRGTAYVVFEDLPLGPFGNRPPQLAFEVFRRPRGETPSLEDRLEGVCLIPGAGEFALATQAVMRREGLTRTRPENVNNGQGRADIVVSLDQLQAQCPNLKRVSLVVGWFGDDLRAGHCRVRPGVERAVKSTEPVTWSVAGVGRGEAYVVSEHEGAPAYGGTPSDDSVRQAVAELKARGLEVTLYPFVFMDIPAGNGLPAPHGGDEQAAYPWRGRITGEGGASADAEVAAIIGGEHDWGLRRMARHYAALAAETGADGLVIGSEMVGLTTLRDAAGGYPAVEAFRALADECRVICGPDVAITYAADWTEYFGHHPEDGSGDVIFHLDPLWADPAISHVGVDWYPPLTAWRDGDEDPADLAVGVAGGEGFDWFYASDADRVAGVRTLIEDEAHGEHWVFRPKDLVGWWSNAHHDRPGGLRSDTSTAWTPGMKPIRLMEFGCAAVHRGANAPNRFRDAKSSEDGLPPFSDGSRDDLIQRRALEAMLAHFADPANNPAASEYDGRMLEAMDAWCWDARPYPDFPGRSEVWADAANWSTGHWLNGRLAGEARDLVAAILKRGGLAEDDIAIEGVDAALAGYVIDRSMRMRDALTPLLAALDAGVFERGGKVAVIGEGWGGAVALPTDALALPDDGDPIRAVRILEPPPDVARVRYIDEAAGYQSGSVVLRSEDEGASGAVDLDLPVVCGRGLASRTAERLLVAEVETVRIALGPLEALRLEPGDVVALEDREGLWRVDRIDLAEMVEAHLRPVVEVGRTSDDLDWKPGEPPGLVGRPFMAVLDLPPLPGQEGDDRPLVAVAADPWRPMRVFAGGSAAALTQRADVAQPATVGVLMEALEPGPLHRWDETNTVVVKLEGRAPESGDAGAVLAGANTIAVEAGDGWELVQFREATLVDPGVWRLSGLLRGHQGTDGEMRAGASVGARVVVLDRSLARADVVSGERGAPLSWRAGPAGSPPGGDAFAEIAAAWVGVQARPWSVAHLKVSASDDGLAIRWVPRARLDGDRWDGETVAADPGRYRVRVTAGAGQIREWQVDDAYAVYAQTMIDADFPGGLGSEAQVRVGQWSPRFGWGGEAAGLLADGV